MKTSRIKIAASVLALAVAVGWAFGAVADKSEWTDPRKVGGALTVNWTGHLVVARWESVASPRDGFLIPTPDSLVHNTGRALGLRADERVEIGLRSDGVLVWRPTAK